MNLPALLQTAGDFCIMRTDIVDKLLKCSDGDGALLYLYALRHPTDFNEKNAARELNFPAERMERALFTLANLEFTAAAPAAKPEKKLPNYRAGELRQARTQDHRFSAVCEMAEKTLGRMLTEGQLRSLFTAYDYLGLPAEVIIELLCHLKRDKTVIRRSDIEREASLWADMGLNTVEAAAQYLAQLDAEKPLIDAICKALELTNTTLTAAEQRHISSFIAMGFPPDAVALAAQRTQQQLGKFSWKYLSKILASWDSKGIHTVSEITALEPGRASQTNAAAMTASPAAAVNQTATPPAQLETWEKQWMEESAARRRRRQEDT